MVSGINTPTINGLKKANYCYKGFAYDFNRYLFKTPECDPYNEEILKKIYKSHNHSVKEYFKKFPNKLIVINVSKNEDYFSLCEFLGKEPIGDNFPWENKTILKYD